MAKCPKCKAKSGDDWTQCGGVCPMPMSPHYKPKVQLNINGDEAMIGDCDWCGKQKLIYAPNFCDPYTTELYPEKEDHFAGDWCEDCWDNRKGDI